MEGVSRVGVTVTVTVVNTVMGTLTVTVIVIIIGTVAVVVAVMLTDTIMGSTRNGMTEQRRASYGARRADGGVLPFEDGSS